MLIKYYDTTRFYVFVAYSGTHPADAAEAVHRSVDATSYQKRQLTMNPGLQLWTVCQQRRMFFSPMSPMSVSLSLHAGYAAASFLPRDAL